MGEDLWKDLDIPDFLKRDPSEIKTHDHNLDEYGRFKIVMPTGKSTKSFELPKTMDNVSRMLLRQYEEDRRDRVAQRLQPLKIRREKEREEKRKRKETIMATKMAEMVEEYNRLATEQGKPTVKRFENTAVAQKRIDALTKSAGKAADKSAGKAKAEPKTRASKAEKAEATTKTNGKAAKANGKDKVPARAVTKERGPRNTKLSRAEIVIKAKDCPYKDGSAGAKHFGALKGSKTVRDFVDKFPDKPQNARQWFQNFLSAGHVEVVLPTD